MSAMDVSRAVWRKAGRSFANGDCVEVAALGSAVAVRDSKNKSGPALTVRPTEWSTFINTAKIGKFDLL